MQVASFGQGCSRMILDLYIYMYTYGDREYPRDPSAQIMPTLDTKVCITARSIKSKPGDPPKSGFNVGPVMHGHPL